MPALPSTPLCFPSVKRCLNILHFGIIQGTACLASPVKFAVLSCVHPSCHLLTVDTSGLCMFSLVYAPLVDFSVGKKACGRTEPKGAVTRQGCACLPAALGGLCQATFCSLPPSQTALCLWPWLAGWRAFCQCPASLASGSCVVWLQRGLSHVGSPPLPSSPDLTIHVPGLEDPRLCTPHPTWW